MISQGDKDRNSGIGPQILTPLFCQGAGISAQPRDVVNRVDKPARRRNQRKQTTEVTARRQCQLSEAIDISQLKKSRFLFSDVYETKWMLLSTGTSSYKRRRPISWQTCTGRYQTSCVKPVNPRSDQVEFVLEYENEKP